MCADEAPSSPVTGPADEQNRESQQQQQAPPRPPGDSPCYTPPDVLRWQAPPLILEWGCAQLRTHEKPAALERWWQLAALAVAQRSEDPQFLIGDVNIGRGPEWGEIVNTQDEIKHLEHVMERFPNEGRFQLAYGIAHERDFPRDAMKIYRGLERDPDVGGEAMMRLGALQVRRRSNVAQIAPPQAHAGNAAAALQVLEKVDTLTRDPHVVYLAHYFTGQAHAADGRLDAAERAFRRASAAMPTTQSASLALAALVFNDGRRTEGQYLIRAMLDADPPVRDPWRTFVHADDRFWPRLIARLRAEVVR
jgi:tetratricopeptide (TPR) repeat protein